MPKIEEAPNEFWLVPENAREQRILDRLGIQFGKRGSYPTRHEAQKAAHKVRNQLRVLTRSWKHLHRSASGQTMTEPQKVTIKRIGNYRSDVRAWRVKLGRERIGTVYEFRQTAGLENGDYRIQLTQKRTHEIRRFSTIEDAVAELVLRSTNGSLWPTTNARLTAND